MLFELGGKHSTRADVTNHFVNAAALSNEPRGEKMSSQWIGSKPSAAMPGGSGGARWSRYASLTAIIVGCSGSEASDPPGQDALGYAGFQGWGGYAGQVPGQGG